MCANVGLNTYLVALPMFADCYVDVWLDVMRLEKQYGNASRAGVLYSQAVKTLRDDLVDTFIKQHTTMH